jgi:peptidoglycan-N-acetylglucosamine deacetylase
MKSWQAMRRQLYFCVVIYSRMTGILKTIFPHLTWELPGGEKNIYLTFDDGPHQNITPEVLEVLDEFNAKATFFCVGENVRKYESVYQKILNNGHKTGNHTYNHLNGWETSSDKYYRNIEKCAGFVDSNLFRPPYGKIKPTQASYLKMHYFIIMWSVLTEDYNKDLLPEKCLEKAMKTTHPGSIIVFHDSEKAQKNMLFVLPRFLEHFTQLGYRFPIIPL